MTDNRNVLLAIALSLLVLLGWGYVTQRWMPANPPATKVVNGQHSSTDNSMAQQCVLRSEQGGIRRGVKGGEHLLVRVRPALCIRAQGDIDDR